MPIAFEFCDSAFAVAAAVVTSISFLGDVFSVQALATDNLPLFIFQFWIAVFQRSRGRATAVASVPVTPADIIFVVAIAVTFPMAISTSLATCFRHWRDKSRVLAFAIFAKLVVVCGSTTVTFVPSTHAVIVTVITIIVARPRRMTA